MASDVVKFGVPDPGFDIRLDSETAELDISGIGGDGCVKANAQLPLGSVDEGVRMGIGKSVVMAGLCVDPASTSPFGISAVDPNDEPSFPSSFSLSPSEVHSLVHTNPVSKSLSVSLI